MHRPFNIFHVLTAAVERLRRTWVTAPPVADAPPDDVTPEEALDRYQDRRGRPSFVPHLLPARARARRKAARRERKRRSRDRKANLRRAA